MAEGNLLTRAPPGSVLAAMARGKDAGGAAKAKAAEDDDDDDDDDDVIPDDELEEEEQQRPSTKTPKLKPTCEACGKLGHKTKRSSKCDMHGK